MEPEAWRLEPALGEVEGESTPVELGEPPVEVEEVEEVPELWGDTPGEVEVDLWVLKYSKTSGGGVRSISSFSILIWSSGTPGEVVELTRELSFPVEFFWKATPAEEAVEEVEWVGWVLKYSKTSGGGVRSISSFSILIWSSGTPGSEVWEADPAEMEEVEEV